MGVKRHTGFCLYFTPNAQGYLGDVLFNRA